MKNRMPLINLLSQKLLNIIISPFSDDRNPYAHRFMKTHEDREQTESRIYANLDIIATTYNPEIGSLGELIDRSQAACIIHPKDILASQ